MHQAREPMRKQRLGYQWHLTLSFSNVGAAQVWGRNGLWWKPSFALDAANVSEEPIVTNAVLRINVCK